MIGKELGVARKAGQEMHVVVGICDFALLMREWGWVISALARVHS